MSLHQSIKSRLQTAERFANLKDRTGDDYDGIDPVVGKAMSDAGEAWLKANRVRDWKNGDPMTPAMAETMILAGLAAQKALKARHATIERPDDSPSNPRRIAPMRQRSRPKGFYDRLLSQSAKAGIDPLAESSLAARVVASGDLVAMWSESAEAFKAFRERFGAKKRRRKYASRLPTYKTRKWLA